MVASRWLTGSDVVSLIDVCVAIDALEKGLAMEANRCRERSRSKVIGMGISDVSLGIELYEKARDQNKRARICPSSARTNQLRAKITVEA